MGLSHAELVMHRRQIEAIIKADPVKLVFRRKPKIKTIDGSYIRGPEVEVRVAGMPQEVTMIPFKRRMTEALVNTELGDVPDLPYVMLGRYDLDVQEKDRFTWQGDEYVVEEIDIKTEVRKAVHVDYFGGDPDA